MRRSATGDPGFYGAGTESAKRRSQRLWKRFVTGIILLAFTLPGIPQDSEEQGRQIVQKICTSCHDMDTITASRRTEAGWKESVDDMVSRGADGRPQELAEVIRYLTKYFGKLNVNTATAPRMVEFLGIAQKDASAIVQWRDHNAKFQNLDQLKAVPGIDTAKIEQKREIIAFND